MTREEACEILQVAPTADDGLITQAYGHLVRRCQTEADSDRSARLRLDELHQAFLVLHPAGTEDGFAPQPTRATTSHFEPLSFGEFFAEMSRLVGRISSRWHGRVVEVAILVVTTAWLGFLALSSGANALWTMLALAIAGVAIWAPWRREGPPPGS